MIMEKIKDLPFDSYLIGFLQTDGSYYENTRNRGRITLEISMRDKDIIEKIHEAIPSVTKITYRKRDTNFKKDNEFISLNIFNLETREYLKEYIPPGKKSLIITPPTNISEYDYWRGIIDGDGSLGLTNKGFPFISLTTNSDNLCKSFLDFISEKLNIEKTINRNKRDNMYNIVLYKEQAQELTKILYYDNCLCLNRKKQKANDIINWVRPATMKKIDFERRKWTKKEDEYIISNSIENSIKNLDRNENAIKIRLYRLLKKQRNE